MSTMAARLKQLAAAAASRLGVLAAATDVYLLLRDRQRPARSRDGVAHTDLALPPPILRVEHRPAGALGNPTQDLWVLRRAPPAGAKHGAGSIRSAMARGRQKR